MSDNKQRLVLIGLVGLVFLVLLGATKVFS